MDETTLENEAITESATEKTEETAVSEKLEESDIEVSDGTAEENADTVEDESEETVDYAALAAEDLAELKAQFPALKELPSLAALPNPVRYAELRDMGLSPKEAYLATGGTARKRSDNRAHLLSAVPRSSALATGLPSGAEMAEARRLFSNLTDAQICKLYKKVTN